MKVKLIAYSLPAEGDVDKFVAECAAISHAPQFRELSPKKVEKLIKVLKQLGHESVFEHASFTFAIEGISRVCTHQLVRHRLASYTQQSQRYVSLKNPKFIVPESIVNSEYMEKVEELLDKASTLYRKMVENGIRKEDARFVLPQGIETKIIVTMNARELRHFFKLRCAKDAQWEIRKLAIEMLKNVYEVAPLLFEDLYQEFVESK